MKKVLLAITLFTASFNFAQDGDLDVTFNTDGTKTIGWTGQVSDVTKVLVQADGKTILVGNHTDQNTFYDIGVTRLNADGSFDTNFGTNGTVSISVGTSDFARTAALTSDGKIIIAGSTDNNVLILKLNSDGTFDTSFGSNGITITNPGATSDIYGIEILSSGKILLAGHIYYGSTSDFLIARYSSVGLLDNTFATASAIPGLLGLSFNAYDYAKSIATEANGDIIISGVTYVNGKGYSVAAAKVNDDGGTLITAFGTNGKTVIGIPASNDEVYGMATNANGEIYLSGKTNNNCLILKLDANGALMNSFDTDGMLVINPGDPAQYSIFFDVKLQSDGKIIVGGYQSTVTGDAQFSLMRFNDDGTTDISFAMEALPYSSVDPDQFKSIAIQSDGKIIAGGHYGTGGNETAFFVARYIGDAGSAGINENEANAISVYPNPTHNELRFNMEGTQEAMLMDINGKVLLNTSISNNATIDISTYTSGVYFLKIDSKTIKIIKD